LFEHQQSASRHEMSITPRQFIVLSAFAANEGANQTRIVDVTGIDRSTLGDIVQRLLREGLLRRQRSRIDARSYTVQLTPEGREMLSRATAWSRAVELKLLEELAEDARVSLVESLDVIGGIQSPVALK